MQRIQWRLARIEGNLANQGQSTGTTFLDLTPEEEDLYKKNSWPVGTGPHGGNIYLLGPKDKQNQ
jgi:hypothetical protein